MWVVILGAGYGTRLERDLKSDTSGQYSYLLGVPKPLLPIGGKPLISRWMQCLRDAKGIREVIVAVRLAYKMAGKII